MARCKAACIVGWSAAAIGGFIAIDHFVLNDRFGIWIRLRNAISPYWTSGPSQGVSEVEKTPLGKTAIKAPPKGIPDLFNPDASPAQTKPYASVRQDFLANLRKGKTPSAPRNSNCSPACQKCLASKAFSSQACHQLK